MKCSVCNQEINEKEDFWYMNKGKPYCSMGCVEVGNRNS